MILDITTHRKKEVLDITDTINANLPRSSGVVHLLVLHTTAALTTADLDPGTDLDMLDAYTNMVPQLAYRHPHDPSHVPDHILSSMIGTSIGIPFEDGNCILGTWQRIVLIEFDGPRTRRIAATIITTS